MLLFVVLQRLAAEHIVAYAGYKSYIAAKPGSRYCLVCTLATGSYHKVVTQNGLSRFGNVVCLYHKVGI